MLNQHYSSIFETRFKAKLVIILKVNIVVILEGASAQKGV